MFWEPQIWSFYYQQETVTTSPRKIVMFDTGLYLSGLTSDDQFSAQSWGAKKADLTPFRHSPLGSLRLAGG